jgi:hypothetical protein
MQYVYVCIFLECAYIHMQYVYVYIFRMCIHTYDSTVLLS